MESHPTRPGDTDCESLILLTLRQLSVGLSAFDPDHPLHDHFTTIDERGSELGKEGLRHLADVVSLASASATELAELEFSTVGEMPDSCREMLAEAREGISELSWILWAVQVALESPEAVGEPPGRPGEVLMQCGARATDAYSTSTSREDSANLQARRRTR